MNAPYTGQDRYGAECPVEFSPLTQEHFSMLSAWLSRPHVRQWWQHDPLAVEADFGPAIEGCDPTSLFLVEENSRPVGLIQSYRIGDHPDWAAALRVIGVSKDDVGIDYLIGEATDTGRGLGTKIVSRFVERLWRDYPRARAIVVAAQRDNRASWRTLEKVGFRRLWSGVLDSNDPSDTKPNNVYELLRSRS